MTLPDDSPLGTVARGDAPILRTRGVGPAQTVHWGSDVAQLRFDGTGLRIRIAREVAHGRVTGLDVDFRQPSAFRLLDELDLAAYWHSPGFARGFHVLEVGTGGWSTEEAGLRGYARPRREWLVVTGNACVSVFCGDAPVLTEASWSSDERGAGAAAQRQGEGLR